jgi:hypothetical protein
MTAVREACAALALDRRGARRESNDALTHEERHEAEKIGACIES